MIPKQNCYTVTVSNHHKSSTLLKCQSSSADYWWITKKVYLKNTSLLWWIKKLYGSEVLYCILRLSHSFFILFTRNKVYLCTAPWETWRPGESRYNTEYTLEGVPINCRAYVHTQSHPAGNLEMPIFLPCVGKASKLHEHRPESRTWSPGDASTQC